MKTITSAAIAGALFFGSLAVPAAADAYPYGPNSRYGPQYGPRLGSPNTPEYRNGPEFPETRDAGTFSTPSDCQRAGDKLVSNRTARSYNCTLGPNATYKLRINPKF